MNPGKMPSQMHVSRGNPAPAGFSSFLCSPFMNSVCLSLSCQFGLLINSFVCVSEPKMLSWGNRILLVVYYSRTFNLDWVLFSLSFLILTLPGDKKKKKPLNTNELPRSCDHNSLKFATPPSSYTVSVRLLSWICRENSWSQFSNFLHIQEKQGFHFLIRKLVISIDRMWFPMWIIE